MIKIEVQDQGLRAGLQDLARRGVDMSPAMREIAALLKDQTAQNFADQAGPGGPWAPFKRAPRNKRRTSAKLLRDTARLSNSVVAASGPDFAQVGTNVVYAAIHQFGGVIDRAPHSRLLRHRADRKGELLRTAMFNGKGLVFARASHKQVVQRWFEVKAYRIRIPARPFLPVSADGTLQPGLAPRILDILRRHLSSAA